jgi:hypothetical protein
VYRKRQLNLLVLLEARISNIRAATSDGQRQTIESVKTFLTAKLQQEIESTDVRLAMSAARTLMATTRPTNSVVSHRLCR